MTGIYGLKVHISHGPRGKRH